MSLAPWQLVLCGINHKTATVEQREPLQLGQDDIPAALDAYSDQPGVYECVVLSTCNRVEFYAVLSREVDPLLSVAEFYHKFRDNDIKPLRESFYIRKGRHVAAHMFRVAGGLDSMVLGENQIVGQLKDAYSSACQVKTAGKMMHRLLHQAFRVAKQVRTDTEMGRGACSVSSAAIDLLRDRATELTHPSVLFVGVNQMIKLAATNLSSSHHSRLMFANRTPEKAKSLAAAFHGTGHGLDTVEDLLPQADILISCTGSAQPVITREMLRRFVKGYPEHKLLVADLAIPRDVDADREFADSIEVHDLESIKAFVEQQKQRREAAIPAAEKIIDLRLNEFGYWYNHAIHESTFEGMSDSFEQIRREELDPIVRQLPFEQQEAVENASRRLVDRLLRIKARQESDKT
ncbi:glutamyl-tRNA reductase [candidate division GN15 bacterium]|nr:glutamyl-tRNA reductase [candidate division GN15 bacterium]